MATRTAAPNSPISLNKGLAVSVKGLWWHYWGLWWWGSNEAPGASGVRMAEQEQADGHDHRPIGWTTACLGSPDKGSCHFIVQYTQPVFLLFWSGGILDGVSGGRKKTSGCQLWWATEQSKDIATGFVSCLKNALKNNHTPSYLKTQIGGCVYSRRM